MPGRSGPLEIASSRTGHLLDALSRACDALGFPQAAGHDEVLRQLVLARVIALDGAVKSVNRELEAEARDLAGLKGYVTSLAACPDGTPVTAEFVIGSYHELRDALALIK